MGYKMTGKITGDMNVRRMFNARPPNHTPIAIRDTMTLRSHIAILKKERIDEDRQLLLPQVKEMTCMRIMMMREANDHEA
jgi:hypothetical protein